jgi:hypothetical protein
LIPENLLNDDLGTAFSFAGKALCFDFPEADGTIYSSVDGEVTAEVGAFAGLLGFANLSDENFASTDFLAAKTLHTESLTG